MFWRIKTWWLFELIIPSASKKGIPMRAAFSETARNERLLSIIALCAYLLFTGVFSLGTESVTIFVFWSELDFCNYPECDWVIAQKIFPNLLKWPLLWFCKYRAILGHKICAFRVKSLSHPASFATVTIQSKSDINIIFGCRVMCVATSSIFGNKKKPSEDEETCISPILPCSCCGSATAEQNPANPKQILREHQAQHVHW